MPPSAPEFLAARTPRTLWVELTSKCPFDCIFCSRKMRRGAGGTCHSRCTIRWSGPWWTRASSSSTTPANPPSIRTRYRPFKRHAPPERMWRWYGDGHGAGISARPFEPGAGSTGSPSRYTPPIPKSSRQSIATVPSPRCARGWRVSWNCAGRRRLAGSRFRVRRHGHEPGRALFGCCRSRIDWRCMKLRSSR